MLLHGISHTIVHIRQAPNTIHAFYVRTFLVFYQNNAFWVSIISRWKINEIVVYFPQLRPPGLHALLQCNEATKLTRPSACWEWTKSAVNNKVLLVLHSKPICEQRLHIIAESLIVWLLGTDAAPSLLTNGSGAFKWQLLCYGLEAYKYLTFFQHNICQWRWWVFPKCCLEDTEGNGNSAPLTPSMCNLSIPFSVGDNPTAIFDPTILHSMRHFVPNARIIVTLRNPTDRWVSR